jgi:hypothetical protein
MHIESTQMNRYLNIAGSEGILGIFEVWPSFHDAEIISVLLDRNSCKGQYGPTVTIKLHCFQISNEVVGNQYKTIKHNIVTFAFYDVVNFNLGYGFGQQNSLSGFTISDIRGDQLENINYKVCFDAHTTCDLHFNCSKLEVLSIESGIPVGSVYA